MPQRSYSVSQAIAAVHHHYYHQQQQGMNTSATTTPGNRRHPTSSFHIQAPPLPGTLARELRYAIPRLERILADELSSQTLPLFMELLQTWATSADVDPTSNGAGVPPRPHDTKENQLVQRSMTRSKLSKWFLDSFSRKKPAVYPSTPLSHQNISDPAAAVSPASMPPPSPPAPPILSEQEQELGSLPTTPSSFGETPFTPSTKNHHGGAMTRTMTTTTPVASLVVRSMPRATTTITGFLNKLGLSVMKKVTTTMSTTPSAPSAAAAAAAPDTAVFFSPALPQKIYSRNNHTKSAVTLASTVSAESSFGSLSVTPKRKKTKKQHHPVLSWEDEEIWRPRGEDKVIPRKPVQHSKTDMDMLREQSVPYIKMGMSRQQNESNNGVRSSSSPMRSMSRRRHDNKPTTFYDLQQWHQRFHDQQQNPDKLEANIHRVTAALFRMIEMNHKDGFFEYDEDAFSGSPMLHLQDQLFGIQPTTTREDIFEQIAYVFECGELTSEHAILTYIYVERMLRKSGQALCDINWRFILLAGMLLAVKVWDDCAVYNSDFVQIFPELNIPLVNKIERHFLRAIDYEVGCTCANFAATYFDLRDAGAALLAYRK